MSEYFRKYIKKEHYPNPPYPDLYQAKTSNSRHLFVTVSSRHSTTVSGRNPMGRIGTSCGVKRSRSTGSSRNTASLRDARSITSEDGANCARKIYSVKISRSTREPLTSKETTKNPVSTIFCPRLSCFPANMSSSTRNSSVPNMIANHSGS